jgi:hypothetical protein
VSVFHKIMEAKRLTNRCYKVIALEDGNGDRLFSGMQKHDHNEDGVLDKHELEQYIMDEGLNPEPFTQAAARVDERDGVITGDVQLEDLLNECTILIKHIKNGDYVPHEHEMSDRAYHESDRSPNGTPIPKSMIGGGYGMSIEDALPTMQSGLSVQDMQRMENDQLTADAEEQSRQQEQEHKGIIEPESHEQHGENVKIADAALGEDDGDSEAEMEEEELALPVRLKGRGRTGGEDGVSKGEAAWARRRAKLGSQNSLPRASTSPSPLVHVGLSVKEMQELELERLEHLEAEREKERIAPKKAWKGLRAQVVSPEVTEWECLQGRVRVALTCPSLPLTLTVISAVTLMRSVAPPK